jgi:hypothetical protein
MMTFLFWKAIPFAQMIGSIVAIRCFLAQMIVVLSLSIFTERSPFEIESDIHPFIRVIPEQNFFRRSWDVPE